MTFEELTLQAQLLTQEEVDALSADVVRIYQRAQREAAQELQTVYAERLSGVEPENYLNELAKRDRLGKLVKKEQHIYREAEREARPIIKAAAALAISNTYYRSVFALSYIQPFFTPLPQPVIQASVFSKIGAITDLSARQRERIVDIYGDLRKYYPKSGTELNKILSGKLSQYTDDVERVIRASVLNGDSYEKSARALSRVLEIDKNRAMKIIRTESHRNIMQGMYASTKAAQDAGLDAKRQIQAVRDNRTRPQSVAVDGQIENADGTFTYPGGVLVTVPGNSGVAGWDINDRERVILSVDGVDPELMRARDPATGETDIMSYKSFSDWAKDNGLTKNKYGQLVT